MVGKIWPILWKMVNWVKRGLVFIYLFSFKSITYILHNVDSYNDWIHETQLLQSIVKFKVNHVH